MIKILFPTNISLLKIISSILSLVKSLLSTVLKSYVWENIDIVKKSIKIWYKYKQFGNYVRRKWACFCIFMEIFSFLWIIPVARGWIKNSAQAILINIIKLIPSKYFFSDFFFWFPLRFDKLRLSKFWRLILHFNGFIQFEWFLLWLKSCEPWEMKTFNPVELHNDILDVRFFFSFLSRETGNWYKRCFFAFDQNDQAD